MLILAIGSLPLLLLETARADLTGADRVSLDVVNIAVLAAFAVDYLVELASAKPKSAHVRREWASLLVVATQSARTHSGTHRVRGAASPSSGPRLAIDCGPRRVVAIGGTAATEGRAILRRHAAGFALGAAGMTWLSSAVAFTLAEDVGANGRLHSVFDALWWSSTTITTVGYGDVYPVTAAGRLVGVVTMFVGISTFAVVTAKVAEFLVRTRDDTSG